MTTIGNWIAGALVTVLGFLGLVMASRAVDTGILLFGLLLAGLAVGFNFFLLKRSFDETPE